MDLINYIRDIPDFPKKGILYKDISPLLQNKKAFSYTTEQFYKRHLDNKIDLIVGIEARGFITGSIIANTLSLPFIPIRKKIRGAGGIKKATKEDE